MDSKGPTCPIAIHCTPSRPQFGHLEFQDKHQCQCIRSVLCSGHPRYKFRQSPRQLGHLQ